MAKYNPRTVSVKNKVQLTANMIRITLAGEALADFPEDQESGYIKLMFAAEQSAGADEAKPILRSYTIRRFDLAALELEVDFVAHGDNGPASAWARAVNIGENITILGPGAKKMVDLQADWFFIAGDMTALPAISVNLEQLPDNARGYAVLEVMHEDDRQALTVPEGVQLHWVINSKPDQPNSILADAVKALPWRTGVANVWLAAEFSTMRILRRYFKQERAVARGDIYASSYWKMGETDEGNKRAKREDAEA